MDFVKPLWFLTADIGRLVLLANVLLLAFYAARLFPEMKALGYFLVLDLATELVVGWYSRMHLPNLPLLHIYTVLEFLALSYFYKSVFKKWGMLQRHFWWWMAFIALLLIANSCFLEPLDGFNSNAKTLTQIIMIGYAVLYFFQSFGKEDLSLPHPLAIALVNAAVLLYYSGSLFIFMFSKALNDPVTGASIQTQSVFWLFNSLLFLTFQVLVFWAILKTIQRAT